MTLNSFFSKSESDLDGYHFKKMFEATPKAQLMDVRTFNEVMSGTIGRALNIDFMSNDFGTKIQKLDIDKTYFVFCRSGGRSAAAVKQMQRHGLKAYNLVGGINAWPR